MPMPPLDSFPMVEEVPLVHSLFVEIGIIIDHRCNPLHNSQNYKNHFDVLVMHGVNDV